MAKSHFLDLPTETRLQIYSYLLPSSLTRDHAWKHLRQLPILPCDALRATCRKIKGELDPEVLKDCKRYVELIGQRLGEGDPYCRFNIWYHNDWASTSIPTTFSGTKTLEITIDSTKAGPDYSPRRFSWNLLPNSVFDHLSPHIRTIRLVLAYDDNRNFCFNFIKTVIEGETFKYLQDWAQSPTIEVYFEKTLFEAYEFYCEQVQRLEPTLTLLCLDEHRQGGLVGLRLSLSKAKVRPIGS